VLIASHSALCEVDEAGNAMLEDGLEALNGGMTDELAEDGFDCAALST
jgi:hypothetical protein